MRLPGVAPGVFTARTAFSPLAKGKNLNLDLIVDGKRVGRLKIDVVR